MADKIILSEADIERIIGETVEKIMVDVPNMDDLAIVGIQTRGVELAGRLKKGIEAKTGASIRMGVLDITFYRDDLSTRGVLPAIKETRIEFNITNKTILLVDDVLFTGRTTKAALETLTSFGRPRAIRLFVLIDRGNRELPIRADYCGHCMETALSDKVKVRLSPVDEEGDRVILSRE
ncbi:MAG TPA: bifunctional pyr operon transcriptional regulator/uracil phosphoribosyltransferase PyrR [Spirochaetes bacterium]|nr:bifunctional pyr operon transcriptional regulator/uracil phosphoribosyltransferase PyrR [Spirochaetota bacterium]